MPARPHGLQIDQDPARERREWRVQHVAWALASLFILAAALGLTGPGPLSARNASAGGLRLAWDGCAHRDAPSRLVVRLDPGDARADRVRLRLQGPWLDGVRLERIEPEPLESDARDAELALDFRPPAEGELVVTILFEPAAIGMRRGRVTGPGEASVAFGQFVFP